MASFPTRGRNCSSSIRRDALAPALRTPPSGFARDVRDGTSRPFAVTQQCGRFRGEADMRRCHGRIAAGATDPQETLGRGSKHPRPGCPIRVYGRAPSPTRDRDQSASGRPLNGQIYRYRKRRHHYQFPLQSWCAQQPQLLLIQFLLCAEIPLLAIPVAWYGIATERNSGYERSARDKRN
jgi:hypothetical protein